MKFSRNNIATYIYNSLKDQENSLKNQFAKSSASIGYIIIDDLLPNELVLEIYNSFPKKKDTVLKKSLREYKHIAYQMNKYPKLLEEAIYAFQDKRVVKLIEEICDLNTVLPDANLYAGGLSMMGEGNFLNPHLDNSHDKDRKRWRVLNLLFYVTPNWKKEFGGNLELWSSGIKKDPVTITSEFNRLIVMATHNNSWHSVSKVISKDLIRCCVSNYYFSDKPIHNSDSFHVTSFRGRSNESMKDFLLRTDSKIRMGLRKLFKKGIKENPHQYKK